MRPPGIQLDWARSLGLGAALLVASACGDEVLFEAGASSAAGSNAASTAGAGGAGGAGTTTGAGGATAATTGSGGAAPSPITKVFLIMMENLEWSQIEGSPSAPYLNGLLAQGAHAEHYKNPPGLHPSEPNYIWLEAGTTFGIANDLPPVFNHQSSKDHLVTRLEAAGRTWRSYQEDIPGTACPLAAVALYAPKHNPMVFFDDVTDTLDELSPHCITHVRPYPELYQDLLLDRAADYNLLTPNLCHDMHDNCAPSFDRLKQGDEWLAAEVPKLLASKAYEDGAVIFVVWDEGPGISDGPIGLIALGKRVKAGYSNQIPYTHSSTLRTVQELLGVTPFLGAAAAASVVDLSDLFTTFP